MKRSEELKLIRRASAGDRDAAEVFIRAFQGQLFAYMLRMSGRPDVAEDIVQDAFVRVLTNLDRFDPRFRFSTWLFTIARRLYLNSIQKHAPSYNSEVMESRPDVGRDSPGDLVIDHDSGAILKDELQRGLAKLTLEQREILILFHQQNWPIWLIAQHLEMPEGTVKSHLHRGRRRMREILTHAGSLMNAIEEVHS